MRKLRASTSSGRTSAAPFSRPMPAAASRAARLGSIDDSAPWCEMLPTSSLSNSRIACAVGSPDASAAAAVDNDAATRPSSAEKDDRRLSTRGARISSSARPPIAAGCRSYNCSSKSAMSSTATPRSLATSDRSAGWCLPPIASETPVVERPAAGTGAFSSDDRPRSGYSCVSLLNVNASFDVRSRWIAGKGDNTRAKQGQLDEKRSSKPFRTPAQQRRRR